MQHQYEFPGRVVRTSNGIRCSVLDGPCHCGAFHTLGDFFFTIEERLIIEARYPELKGSLNQYGGRKGKHDTLS